MNHERGYFRVFRAFQKVLLDMFGRVFYHVTKVTYLIFIIAHRLYTCAVSIFTGNN